MTRTCSKCKEIKDIESFPKDKKTATGYGYVCRVCRREYSRQQHQRKMQNPELREKERARDRARNVHRRHKRVCKEVGCSNATLKEFLAVAGKVCQICGTNRKICVDHDHKTGNLRGVLCNRCNFGIGYFRDDPGLTDQASVYLRKNQQCCTMENK
jgi:hypothetical protein